jgi:hypothetical protein
MESVMDSLMVPRHADHRAVTHGYTDVMQRSLASSVLDGGGIGMSVTGSRLLLFPFAGAGYNRFQV